MGSTAAQGMAQQETTANVNLDHASMMPDCSAIDWSLPSRAAPLRIDTLSPKLGGKSFVIEPAEPKSSPLRSTLQMGTSESCRHILA